MISCTSALIMLMIV